jgi:hypothetical protein
MKYLQAYDILPLKRRTTINVRGKAVMSMM